MTDTEPPSVDHDVMVAWIAEQSDLKEEVVRLVLQIELEYMAAVGLIDLPFEWFVFYEHDDFRDASSPIVNEARLARDAERLAGVPANTALLILEQERIFLQLRGAIQDIETARSEGRLSAPGTAVSPTTPKGVKPLTPVHPRLSGARTTATDSGQSAGRTTPIEPAFGRYREVMDRDPAERDALRRQVDDAVLVLFALVADGLGWATNALLNQDVDLAGRVIADDDGIDARCEALIALVKEGLSSEVLSPDELEHLIAVLQIVPELERSADLVEHIAQRVRRGLGGIITPQARGVIQGMCDVAVRMWHDCSVAYRQRSRDAGFELSSMDDELDDLATRLIDAIVVQGTDPQVAADVALVARFYERIGDHAVNLARRIDMLAAPRRLESRKPVGAKRVIVSKEPKRKRGYVSRVMRKVGKLKLAPTDEGFFDLFENSAENARECAENLRKSLETSANLEDCFETIKRCESRGDELTREILSRLDASFVTPYDREDIHALAEEIDDVVDDIFAAASLIELVGIEDQPEELQELTDVLVTMTAEMFALIGSMKSGEGARHRLERIEYLERQGDAIFRRAMGGLFNGGFDALHVIKWKDIVEAIENALNSIENVSDVVESILVKGG